MKTLLDKKSLRKIAQQKRNSMAADGTIKLKSSSIVSKILNSSEFKNAKNIGLYYPIKNEVDLLGLLKVKDKNFYFPRCNDKDLEFCLYKDESSLTPASFGIPEPIGECVDVNILDIIYIPALMANRNNFRLGYGMGFYDRFFTKYKPRAKKILVLVDELISDDFVEDKFDIPADMILSEK